MLARKFLLSAAGLLMLFAAAVNAVVSVPHLHEDLSEIGVRPTLLAAVMLALRFGLLALFGFALIVMASALQWWRGVPPPRLLLAPIAATYIVFGIVAFMSGGSHHVLGYIFMGACLLPAVFARDPGRGFSGPGDGGSAGRPL